MTTSEITSLVIASLGAIGAILAWLAKLRWSKEFADAKNETIKSLEKQLELKDKYLQDQLNAKDELLKVKDAEIVSLQNLTPMKLNEYFDSVKNQLEKYIDDLKEKVKQLKSELKDKESLVVEHQDEKQLLERKIDKILAERELESLDEALKKGKESITKARKLRKNLIGNLSPKTKIAVINWFDELQDFKFPYWEENSDESYRNYINPRGEWKGDKDKEDE